MDPAKAKDALESSNMEQDKAKDALESTAIELANLVKYERCLFHIQNFWAERRAARAALARKPVEGMTSELYLRLYEMGLMITQERASLRNPNIPKPSKQYNFSRNSNENYTNVQFSGYDVAAFLKDWAQNPSYPTLSPDEPPKAALPTEIAIEEAEAQHNLDQQAKNWDETRDQRFREWTLPERFRAPTRDGAVVPTVATRRSVSTVHADSHVFA